MYVAYSFCNEKLMMNGRCNADDDNGHDGEEEDDDDDE